MTNLPEVTEKGIAEVYGELYSLKEQLNGFSVQELELKSWLKERETELILSGAITGKNEQARQAQLHGELAPIESELSDLKLAETSARGQYELCRLKVEYVQQQMRLRELGLQEATK